MTHAWFPRAGDWMVRCCEQVSDARGKEPTAAPDGGRDSPEDRIAQEGEPPAATMAGREKN